MHKIVWTESSKRREQVMIDDHLFRASQRLLNGRSYWRCATKDCGVNAITKGQQLLRVRGEHSHLTDEAMNVRRLFIGRCKAVIRGNPTAPIPRIVNHQSAAYVQSAGVSIINVENLPPVFRSIKSTLYRVKQEVIPLEPATAADLELTGIWSRTKDGQDFILADDKGPDRIIVFGTRALCKNIVMVQALSFSWMALSNQLHQSLHRFTQSTVL